MGEIFSVESWLNYHGKVLSERFKDSRVITDERIGKLSLIDESFELLDRDEFKRSIKFKRQLKSERF